MCTVDLAFCSGGCVNPIHTASNRQLAYAELVGQSWGEIAEMWDAERMASMSAAELARLEAERLAAEAEAARLAPMLALRKAQMTYASEHGITGRMRDAPEKLAHPCRNLYDPIRNAAGKKCCRSVSVVSECWGFEFTDALTSELVDTASGALLPMAADLGVREALASKKARIALNPKTGVHTLKWCPHVCYMSHPGEKSWMAEWNTDRYSVPSQIQKPVPGAAAGRQQPQQQQRAFNQHKPAAQPQKGVPTGWRSGPVPAAKEQPHKTAAQPKKAANAWAALEDD
jgi:hypothetical protein